MLPLRVPFAISITLGWDFILFYVAQFFFNPNSAFSSGQPIDIYLGRDAGGAALFGIQYLHDATAYLYVNGEIAASLSAGTSGKAMEEVWLGLSRGVDGAPGSAAGTMYFDEYISFSAAKDVVVVYLPLIDR